MLTLSRDQARRFLINYQGLDGRSFGSGKPGIMALFDRLGSIQYDPLDAAGRNPDLVLQSRIEDYTPRLLWELLYEDRILIDGWDKMMSLYPVRDWPAFTLLRRMRSERARRTLEYRRSAEALDHLEEALTILREKGPALSAGMDFGRAEKGTWGHGRLAGAALDYLFHEGRVGVFDRRGTQKVYDLIENLLPNAILKEPDPFPSTGDFHRWLLKRRIRSIGLFWNRNSVVWQGIDDPFNNRKYRDTLIDSLLEDRTIEEASIEGIRERVYFLSTDTPDIKLMKFSGVRFLAPLDNLLWDRAFIERLFGFEYRWEVYTPVRKRKFGYYVLPVLYGDMFVGRFEPQVEREENTLNIRHWWWEPGTAVTDELRRSVRLELSRFCGYLGLDGYRDISGTNI